MMSQQEQCQAPIRWNNPDSNRLMLFEFHSVYAAVLKIKVKTTTIVRFFHLSADRFTATNIC